MTVRASQPSPLQNGHDGEQQPDQTRAATGETQIVPYEQKPVQMSDGWDAQRLKRGAPDPDQIWTLRLALDWTPKSDQTVKLFSFASAERSGKDMLWDLYNALAHAEIRVDVLFKGTKWENRVNARGHLGSDPVPSVKLDEGG